MVNRELEPYTKRLHQFEGLKCHTDRIFSVIEIYILQLLKLSLIIQLSINEN